MLTHWLYFSFTFRFSNCLFYIQHQYFLIQYVVLYIFLYKIFISRHIPNMTVCLDPSVLFLLIMVSANSFNSDFTFSFQSLAVEQKRPKRKSKPQIFFLSTQIHLERYRRQYITTNVTEKYAYNYSFSQLLHQKKDSIRNEIFKRKYWFEFRVFLHDRYWSWLPVFNRGGVLVV